MLPWRLATSLSALILLVPCLFPWRFGRIFYRDDRVVLLMSSICASWASAAGRMAWEDQPGSGSRSGSGGAPVLNSPVRCGHPDFADVFYQAGEVLTPSSLEWFSLRSGMGVGV